MPTFKVEPIFFVKDGDTTLTKLTSTYVGQDVKVSATSVTTETLTLPTCWKLASMEIKEFSEYTTPFPAMVSSATTAVGLMEATVSFKNEITATAVVVATWKCDTWSDVTTVSSSGITTVEVGYCCILFYHFSA